MKHFYTAIFLSLFLISCSDQPSCDGSDVTATVIDIVKDEYGKELQETFYNKNFSSRDVYQYASDRNLNYEEVSRKMSDQVKNEAIEHSDSVILHSRFTLNGIRVLKVQEPLKKCECAAKLGINDGELDIEYLAQYTEDDQVYVEVYY